MVNSIHASTTTATNKKKQAERMSQISSKCGSGFTYVRTNLMTCSQAPPHCVGSARALLHSISSWHDISFPFSGNRAYIRKPSPSFQVWWPITSCNNRFLCDLWYSLCLLSCFFYLFVVEACCIVNTDMTENVVRQSEVFTICLQHASSTLLLLQNCYHIIQIIQLKMYVLVYYFF